VSVVPPGPKLALNGPGAMGKGTVGPCLRPALSLNYNGKNRSIMSSVNR